MDRIRLLPFLAVCQVLGIGLADFGGGSSESALVLGSVASLLGIVPIWKTPGQRNVARAMLGGVVLFAVGAYSIGIRLEAADRTRPIAPIERTVEATVAETAWGPGWTRVELVDAIDAVSALPIGRIRVMGGHAAAEHPGIEKVPVGTRVRARLRLRAYRGAANPGSNSREREVERAGIAAVARLVHPALYVSLERDATRGLTGRLARQRQRIAGRLARAGPGNELVRALGVGDKAGLDSEARSAFRQLGLSHLLAISGLHLALVGSLGFGLFRFTAGRSAWLAARFDTRLGGLAAAVAVALGYALIAGWGVPVRRALVLLLALALAVGRGRVGLRAEPIAIAAIGVLAVEPGALFEPGAQLSFAAAAALAFSAGRPAGDLALAGAPGAWRRIARMIADALRASASAIAATAPLAAWQFGSVAPLAAAANLFAVPWTGLVLLPTSLLAATAASFGWMLPAIGASWIAAGSLDFVAWAAGFAGVWVPTPNPAPIWMLAIVAMVIGTIRARHTLLRIGLSLTVSGLLIIAAPATIQPAPPRLITLDVGQGFASIVQGRSAAVLFDGGGATPSRDWGQRAIVPALRALGIERLDRVIVSHADLDHRGGIPSVLERIDVGEVWIPYGARNVSEFAEILDAARARGVRVSERGAGSVAELAGGVTLTGLWPPLHESGRSRNERSLVVRVDLNLDRQGNDRAPKSSVRVLMPGDVGASAEERLLAGSVDLRANVLALGHHGSRTSSTLAFLTAVGPEISIASAPCAGRFAMPHPEVRDRTRSAGSSLWWTGRDGAVIVGLGDPLTAWGYRSGKRGGDRDRRVECTGMIASQTPHRSAGSFDAGATLPRDP